MRSGNSKEAANRQRPNPVCVMAIRALKKYGTERYAGERLTLFLVIRVVFGRRYREPSFRSPVP
jgi:hypothetical protein